MIKSSIDIGTHSVRLLVAEVSPPRTISTDLKITRLGEGLDRTGHVSPAAIERTAKAVAEFREAARRAAAVTITAFGTAALREAANGAEARRRIEEVSGAAVKVIPGDEEARLTYRGVLCGHKLFAHDMVLDIGGGSTEFITGSGSDALLASVRERSLPLGSVRQTERWLKRHPVPPEEMNAMLGEVRSLVRQGIDGRCPQRLIGVAGSVTQVAVLERMARGESGDAVDGMFLSAESLAQWLGRFATMTIEERRALRGMVPERAETVVAGTAILHETVLALGLPGVVVSEFDSLWGAL